MGLDDNLMNMHHAPLTTHDVEGGFQDQKLTYKALEGTSFSTVLDEAKTFDHFIKAKILTP